MRNSETIVAVFADHPAAETAVKTLAANGFDIKNLSPIGKGDHSDEKAIGFCVDGFPVMARGAPSRKNHLGSRT